MIFLTPNEIAKLKSRDFDPAVIAELERLSKQWAAATQDLCRVIEAAFDGVTLGDGVGLQEGQAIDDYLDASARAACRAKDEKEDWRWIATRALNLCHSSLSFFDAEGMRFHLPAFLLADLRGEFDMGMVFCLTHRLHDQTKFSLLSPEQRGAVRAYLLHIATHQDHEFDRPDISRALDDYWTEPD